MFDATLEPVSNRADWIETIELVDDDTGEIITDLSGVSVALQVRARDCCSPILSASSDAGTITIGEGGIIQWHFTKTQMGGLCAGVYDIGITVTRDGITEQELIGTMPVLEGVVR